MDAETSFGDLVKCRRKALGLTQKELAHQLGCSLSVVQKIEIDERHPSREIAELLAEHLEIAAEQQAAFVDRARRRPGVLPAVPDEAPGVPLGGAQRSDNLPAPLTTLIGREWEVQSLCALPRSVEVRLLTISGPPASARRGLRLLRQARCVTSLRRAPVSWGWRLWRRHGMSCRRWRVRSA